MIIGKTEIILQDVHTGETQKILEHNMATNALNDIFRQEGYMKAADTVLGDGFQPIYSTLLGGILLFDTAIPENAAGYFPPGGTSLVGCGVYGVQNTTTDTLRGNFNVDESEYSSNDSTVKYVYDFPTSKGNGTIASVCLTSKYGGYSSYGAPQNGGFESSQQALLFLETGTRKKMTGSSAEFILTVDLDQDIVFTVEPVKNGNYITSLNIRKRRAYMHSMSPVFSASNAGKVVESRTVGINSLYYSYAKNYDKSANTAYYCGVSGKSNVAVENGGTFCVIGIPLSTLVPQTYTITNNSGETLNVDRAFVYRGYAYVNAAGSKAYKISLTDGSCTGISADGNAFPRLSNAVGVGDYIYVPSTISTSVYDYKLYDIDTVSNTVKSTQTSIRDYATYSYAPIIGSDIMFLRQTLDAVDTVRFCIPGNYLATINNLAAPVTKTEAQTMKVIYTITEKSI